MSKEEMLLLGDDGRIRRMGMRRQSTVDDLYHVPEHGKAEIVNGELVRMSPACGRHGYAAGAILAGLFEYARRSGRGVALPDNVGFIVHLPNRLSFSPDVAFWTGAPLTSKFVDGAPIFAVEIRSEDEYGPAAERAIAAKRADYFAAGTQVVWDVDVLRAGTVRVCRAGASGAPRTYSRRERAEAEPALPEWSIAVADLFPPS